MLPKVLIIGETFRQDTGGGITLSNLFRAWPKEKLGVITLSNINDFEICNRYYSIGDNEKRLAWPFQLFIEIRKSGEISNIENSERSKKHKRNIIVSSIKNYFVKLFGKLSHFIGIHHSLNTIRVSENLLHWVNLYKPDLIYFQPNSLSLVLFVKQIYQKTNIPIAIHIVDDYIHTKNKMGLFFSHYEKVVKFEYNEMVKISDVQFSICEEMSMEYFTRFNKKFIPIHNPIIKENWLKSDYSNYTLNDSCHIAYTGRIGIANIEAIIFMVEIVDKLYKEGILIYFDIYSIDEDVKLIRTIKTKRGSSFKHFVCHDKLPETLLKYDILYLPLSTNKRSLRYTRLSMPTKVAEYMISGRPIIVFSAPSTALFRYATEKEWAFVTDNKEKLIRGLRNLIYSKELREKFGKTAQKVALENHDIGKVEMSFISTIKGCLEEKQI